jgi:death-on-curing protein
MIYLTVEEIIRLQDQVIDQSGGLRGVKVRGLVESAAARPQATFGGQDLYPTVAEKAAAIGHSLACNHGFEDGNKRIGHAAMEVFLVLNGYEVAAPQNEQYDVFMRLAAHQMTQDEFFTWVAANIAPLPTP